MSSLLYLSNQELYLIQNQKTQTIDCQAVTQYKKNLQEIKQRKQWKTTGTGAQFMGMTNRDDPNEFSYIFPVDAVLTNDQRMIYAARLQDGCEGRAIDQDVYFLTRSKCKAKRHTDLTWERCSNNIIAARRCEQRVNRVRREYPG